MDYSKLKPIEGEPQIPTRFPNDNSKHIDYVITYKYDKRFDEENAHENESQKKARQDFMKKEEVRKNFLKRLVDEGFDVATTQFLIGDHVNVYILLNCKIERLLQEAERVRLEMRLNNVKIEHGSHFSTCFNIP